MAIKTNISWADATVNFWYGCRKVSAGCKNCYMFRDLPRFGLDPYTVTRVKDKTFYAATKWKEPKTIFTCSWSDFFIEDADEWRAEAWKVIKDTPQHTWKILTKHPDRIESHLPDDWGDGYPNVQLGVTVENEDTLYRLIMLSRIPAQYRFVSFEPLLSEIKLKTIYNEIRDKIDQAIIGGESGPATGLMKARPCLIYWILNLMSDCQYAQFKDIHIKQIGSHLARLANLKHFAGADRDEWPNDIKQILIK